jgi:hypothetical protein
MNRLERGKVLVCGGNTARRDDTAFEQCSSAESNLQQRAKAVSQPPHSRTASVQSKIVGQSARFENR